MTEVEKIRCDACPVMCYIAPGQTGACDRYANDAGRIIRTDPVVMLSHAVEAGHRIVPFAARDWDGVDRYVFDHGQGGSGQPFDWSLLQGETLDNVLLAGGLSADNCVQAAQLGCAGLDFNSGVESAPGVKDAGKIASVFQTLKAY